MRVAAVRTAASVALVLVLPLIALVAVLVRATSPGRVLEREPGRDRHGRHAHLLRFRTTVDGAGTRTHAQLRQIVGAPDAVPLTRVGGVLRATRLDRLPRLLNVAAGHTPERR